MNKETANSSKTDKPWLFKKGQSGNPSGRPKGTMKDYVSKRFQLMTDEQKAEWLTENKISGEVQWKMSEGNPKQDTENTNLNINISTVLDEIENERPKVIGQELANEQLVQDTRQEPEASEVPTEQSTATLRGQQVVEEYNTQE